MKILGLIPARGGSKGIPGKNIKLLYNRPLLSYTYEAAKKSKLLTKVILSSEDPHIISCAKSLGLDVPFIRPAYLSLDSTPTFPVVLHSLNFYKQRGEFFDAVCILQVTSPLRTSEDIDEAIKVFTKMKADSLISVRPVPQTYNPHWCFELNNEGFLNISTGEKQIIAQRQDLPVAYHRDGSIYIVSSDVVFKKDSLFGDKISFTISKSAHYINLDTQEDWDKAEQIFIKVNQ